MIRRIDLRDRRAPDYRDVVPRADFDVEAALDVVRPICDDVRRRGVEAISELTARFDGVEQTDIAVPRAAMTAALENLDPKVRSGLEESIRRLRATCEAEPLESFVAIPMNATGESSNFFAMPAARASLPSPPQHAV